MSERAQLSPALVTQEDSIRLQSNFSVRSEMLFDLDFQIQIFTLDTSDELYSRHIRQQGWDIAWLPKGDYALAARLGDLNLSRGEYQIRITIWSNADGLPVVESQLDSYLESNGVTAIGINKPDWQLQAKDTATDVSSFSWNKGHEDWFFRHFDHAPRVIIHMMLGDSPLLRGRILDVGCGDGIIDMGIFLRCKPRQLVGIDPFAGFRRLAQIARDNGIPPEVLQDSKLQFRQDNGNHMDFPDNSFDVVISWGSLEHIAGGYQQTLKEIRRVLKPGGLLFVHPGLFYGPMGNHLGEFFDDPWIHLKLDNDSLRKQVLAKTPRYIDRAGEFSSPAQYWQWFSELNPISVAGFEEEIRSLDFEPWRVALRHTEMVEYTAEMQNYSFQDLATAELYLSAWNRK